MIKWFLELFGYMPKSEHIESRLITHVRVGTDSMPASQEDIDKVAKEFEMLQDGEIWVTHHGIKIEQHDIPDILPDKDL